MNLTEHDFRRFISRVEVRQGCWGWTGGTDTHGYAQMFVRLPGGKRGRVHKAHRIAYLAFGHQAIPDGYEIDHLCKNRTCTNPAHLEAVTRAENIRRSTISAEARSRRYKDELLRHPLYKARRAKGWSRRELADASGVSPFTILNIELGRTQPRGYIVGRLAQALGTPFESLRDELVVS